MPVSRALRDKLEMRVGTYTDSAVVRIFGSIPFAVGYVTGDITADGSERNPLGRWGGDLLHPASYLDGPLPVIKRGATTGVTRGNLHTVVEPDPNQFRVVQDMFAQHGDSGSVILSDLPGDDQSADCPRRLVGLAYGGDAPDDNSRPAFGFSEVSRKVVSCSHFRSSSSVLTCE